MISELRQIDCYCVKKMIYKLFQKYNAFITTLSTFHETQAQLSS